MRGAVAFLAAGVTGLMAARGTRLTFVRRVQVRTGAIILTSFYSHLAQPVRGADLSMSVTWSTLIQLIVPRRFWRSLSYYAAMRTECGKLAEETNSDSCDASTTARSIVFSNSRTFPGHR